MSINNETKISGKVETRAYDQEPPEHFSNKEKIEWLREKEPTEYNVDYNTTVEGMHSYFVSDLDPGQTLDEDVTHLAIGDDNTTPDVTNSTLNNEVYRETVDTYTQEQNQLLTSTLIGSNEANGNTFREVGLFSGPAESDRMWNHSVISDIIKDDQKSVTIDITLQFNAT